MEGRDWQSRGLLSSTSSSDSEADRFGPPASSCPLPVVYYTDEFARLHQLSFEVETPRVWSPERGDGCSWLDRSSPITFARAPYPSPPPTPHQYANLPGLKASPVYANAGSQNNVYANCTLPRSTCSGYHSQSSGPLVFPPLPELPRRPNLDRLGVGTIDRRKAVTFRRVEKPEFPSLDTDSCSSAESLDPERLIDRLYASIPPRTMPQKHLPKINPLSDPLNGSSLPSPVIRRLRYSCRGGHVTKEDRRRRCLINAAILSVILILLALLLLHLIPKLFVESELHSLPTLAAYRHDAQAQRPNFKGLYHYKNTEGMHMSKPSILLLTGPPTTLSTAEPHPLTFVASGSIRVRTTPPPTTTSTTTIAPSTWLPSFPDDHVCGKNQFKCPSGVSRIPCLWEWERCDGIEDCSDGSDEAFCQGLRCYGNFQCGSGECVSLAKACNGIPDCEDGSDEGERCAAFQCQSYELRCPSGYCIPTEWRCDGDTDCPDHSDEYDCASSCSADQFRCPEGWCVPGAWRCNGIPDCAGGEDELECEVCLDFQCESGECLDSSKICDGTPQCRDGSDEWTCLRTGSEDRVEIRSGSTTWLPICADEWDVAASHEFCHLFGLGPSHSHRTLGLVNSSLAGLKSGSTSLLSRLSRPTLDKCRSGAVAVLCAPSECGVWNTEQRRVKRVVGGQVSGSVQWPSVGVMLHGRQSWLCTVSLISPRFLLTSALCVSRTDPLTKDWTIFLGSAQPNASNPEQVTLRKPLRFIRHPNYKFKSQLSDFDLLIIEVDRPIRTGSEEVGEGGVVAPICLSPSHTPPQELCFTAGWGYTTPGGYFLNKQLRHVELGPAPMRGCNSSQHYNGLLSERHICASNDGPGRQEPCFSDEGAPLMCLSPGGSWYLSGVLSGHSCGSGRRHPAVFTNLAPLSKWVQSIINRP